MTKFFKNQPVRSDTSGMGVVYYVSDTSVGVQFGQCVGTFDLDGRRAKGHPIDLHPLESGKIVLSEWQRERVYDHFYGQWGYTLSDIDFAVINQILSEAEPPKYQPKQGEAVLVRVDKSDKWTGRIATGQDYSTYDWQDGICSSWNFCRPFSPDLVGQITD